MIALTGCLLCLLLVMLLMPDSDMGRTLHRQLVERPLARISAFERHQLIYALLMGSIMLGGGELIFLFGPELVGMWAINLSIYFDAVIVTYALSALAGARSLKNWAWHVMGRLVRGRPRPRSRRRRSASRPDKASNDDEDPAPVRLAA